MSDPLVFVITDAGRAALPSPDNTGVTSVTVTQIGVSASAFTADAAMIALPGEIKRMATFGGSGVAADTIHVTIRDETADAYSLRSFALYLNDGTLFGLYGQAAVISEKTSASLLLLSADFKTADIDATVIEFGSTDFQNPPATETVMGVVELATNAETQTGADATRAVTPKGLLFAFTAWVAAQFSDVWRSSNDGAGSGLDAGLFAGQLPAFYTNIISRLGFTPVNKAGDTMTGPLAATTLTSSGGQFISATSNVVMAPALDGGDIYLRPEGASSTVNQFRIGASITYGGATLWHSENDGAGSGLDAGLFAGQLPAYYTSITARLGYTPLNQTAYTAADVLAKLVTVDGAGSGLDAALLGGQLPSYYTAITTRLGYTPLNQTAYTAADVLAKLVTVDGAGSGLDAALLGGQLPSYYTDIVSRLGFTPVRQGGGIGQAGNIIRLGWSGARLKGQVDNVDLGNVVFDSDVMTSLASAMSLVWGGTFGNNSFRIGALLFQTGVISSVAANGVATINFPTDYSETPFVLLQRRTAGSGVTNADSSAGLEGTPSVSQATVRNTTAGTVIDIMWIAFGPAA